MLPGIQTSIPAGDQARCRGCDHPRPPYTGGYTSIRSTLGTLLAKAEHAGCEICSVLADGILQFLGSECSPLRREDVDEMLLDFNLAGSRRSVEVTFLPTTVKLSFFASKSRFSVSRKRMGTLTVLYPQSPLGSPRTCQTCLWEKRFHPPLHLKLAFPGPFGSFSTAKKPMCPATASRLHRCRVGFSTCSPTVAIACVYTCQAARRSPTLPSVIAGARDRSYAPCPAV